MSERVSTSADSALNSGLNWGGDVFAALLKARRRVVGYVLLGTALGLGIALAVRNQYTSSASFIAQGSTSLNLPAALQGAALSLGLERGGDYSPKFYADLLTSRPILLSAILHNYQIPDGDHARLENYLAIEGFSKDSPDRALERAIRHMARRVSASADVRTNMITLSVRARWPQLSRDIATQLLVALDSLNVGFRQNQSRESREFYETRVLQTRRELDSAEVEVRNFLQTNRVITSPALQFEMQRLQREADRKQALYSIVVQQYEQARLQEARNVPTLTILSAPFVPVKKSFPPRRLIVVLGALIGLAVAWIQLSLSEGVHRFRKDEPGKWQAIQDELRRVPWLGRSS
jgi:uncharacterized protein involved in exopolysaccharide biosynthesis